MLDNLMRAGCYITIILMGYLLRKYRFFKDGDFRLLASIVLKITLPAAIISNFAGKELEISTLAVALIGFFTNLVYVGIGFLLHRRQGREAQAFALQNLSGYNIGNFSMPFIQSFLGSAGVITASLFDVGNAVFSTGGAYSIASLVKDGKKISVPSLLKALTKSVAFDVYVLMTVITLLRLPLPAPVVMLADVVGSANIFLGMLMLGVGLRLPDDLTQLRKICNILGIRYGLAVVFSLIVWFLLPFSPEIRKTSILILFAPVASAVPGFTGELGLDVGLSSAINSISVLCSLAFMVTLLTVVF